MAGKCYSTLQILDDGRYRLDEAFHVFGKDDSPGHSIVEEFHPG
jgi:hypothetical protein